MRRLERDSCPFLLILTLLFRFFLLDLILPVPFPRTQPPEDSSPSFRFCLIDLILSVRFSPYQILSRDCGFCLRMPERRFSGLRRFLGNPAGLSFPDSCFCPSRGGSPAGRPSGHAHSTNHAHVYAPYPPRHPLCHRSALRTVQSLLNGGSSHVRQRSHGRWHGGARAVRGRS